MTKLTRILLIFILSSGIVLIILLSMKPSTMSRENSEEISALVTEVSTGGMKDIIISLEGKREIYYISNGAVRGITAEILSQKLLSKKVKIIYPRPGVFNNFIPAADTRQIAELQLGGEVIYSEFR